MRGRREGGLNIPYCISNIKSSSVKKIEKNGVAIHHTIIKNYTIR